MKFKRKGMEYKFLNSKEIEDIKIALENVKKGRIKLIEQVAKELGISLK